MPTRGELSTEIQNDLGGRTDNALKTVVDDAINRAIEHYEQERYSFNVGSVTLDSVVNQTEYTLPTTVLNIQFVQFRSQGDLDLLQQWPFERYLQEINDDTNLVGEPKYFAVFGRQFFVYPAPNEVAPFTFYSVLRLANVPFTDDAQTNAWTNEALGLIRARVKWDIYMNRIKNASLAEANAADITWYSRKLKADVSRLETTGQIYAPSPF